MRFGCSAHAHAKCPLSVADFRRLLRPLFSLLMVFSLLLADGLLPVLATKFQKDKTDTSSFIRSSFYYGSGPLVSNSMGFRSSSDSSSSSSRIKNSNSYSHMLGRSRARLNSAGEKESAKGGGGGGGGRGSGGGGESGRRESDHEEESKSSSPHVIAGHLRLQLSGGGVRGREGGRPGMKRVGGLEYNRYDSSGLYSTNQHRDSYISQSSSLSSSSSSLSSSFSSSSSSTSSQSSSSYKYSQPASSSSSSSSSSSLSSSSSSHSSSSSSSSSSSNHHHHHHHQHQKQRHKQQQQQQQQQPHPHHNHQQQKPLQQLLQQQQHLQPPNTCPAISQIFNNKSSSYAAIETLKSVSQCLTLSPELAKAVCERNQTTSDKDSAIRLKFCSSYDTVSTFGASKFSMSSCMDYVKEIVKMDAHAEMQYNGFLELIKRFDCTDGYSVKWSCRHCKQAYKDWLCSQTVSFYKAGVRIPPCNEFCAHVEKMCPFFQPKIDTHAGDPSFICKDPDMDEMATGSSPPTCYSLCHLWSPEEITDFYCSPRHLQGAPCPLRIKRYSFDPMLFTTTTTTSTTTVTSTTTPTTTTTSTSTTTTTRNSAAKDGGVDADQVLNDSSGSNVLYSIRNSNNSTSSGSSSSGSKSISSSNTHNTHNSGVSNMHFAGRTDLAWYSLGYLLTALTSVVTVTLNLNLFHESIISVGFS